MCTALEKLKEQGVQEGIAQQIRKLILRWTEKGIEVSEIADRLDISEDEVCRVQSELQKYNQTT